MKKTVLLFFGLAFITASTSLMERVIAQTTTQNNNSALTYFQEREILLSSNPALSVELEDVSIEEALIEIAKIAKAGIYFDSSILPEANINLNFRDALLSEILEELLEGTKLEVNTSGRNIFLKEREIGINPEEFTLQSIDLFQETITGRVTDSQTGEALPGVNILIQGTSTGTTTDSDGGFELGVPDLEVSLIITYIGYHRMEVALGGRDDINVELSPDIQMLDDIVVVGYGTTERRHLTGSVGRVDMSEMESRPVVDFGQALYGRVAGVQVQNPSGRPGESSRVQVRGTGSITAGTAPLIVVDGVALPSFDLNTLNAADIESIDILKDASSSAIYGSRGANGVILVTTKSGTPGDLNVSFNYNFTSQSVMNKIDVMNSAEYAQASIDAAQIAWIRSGGDPNAPNTVEARGQRRYTWPVALENPETLPDVDWQDVIFRDAPMHQANLSVSGGDDRSSYYLSFGLVNQDGIIVNTGYEKYTLNLNADTNLGDWLRIGARANTSYDQQTGSQAIHIRTANQYPPIYPVYSDDGYLGGPHNQPGFEDYDAILFRAHHGHPLQKIDEIDDRDGFDVTGNAFAEVEFLSGLAFRSSFSTFYSRNDRIYFEQADTRIAPGVRRQARHRSWMNRTLNYTWENILMYNENWQDHNIDIVAGYEFNKREYYQLYGERRDYDTDILPYLGAGNTIHNANDSVNENALISMLGRINYNFKGRYLASVSFRRDGSSRFGPENKWGNFPAFSVGWRISDESFMDPLNLLSELTVRSSYGFTGNDSIGNYSWISSMSQNRAAIGNNLFTSYHPSSVQNPDLRWERTKQLNLGVNLGLFEDRILLEGDYYRSDSDGLLLNVPIPSTSGFTSQIRNIGAVRNNGMELSLTSRNISTSNFFWSTQVIFARNRAVVTQLGPDDAPVTFSSNNMDIINQVGETPFSFFGYDYIGAYRNQEEIDAHGVEYPFEVHPGMGMYRDVNGDGRITSDDRTIIGNPEPDFTWAMTHSFQFKSFDLSFLIHGNVGGEIYDANWRRSMFYHEGRNYLREANNRWRSLEEPGDGYVHALTVDVAQTLERESSSYWVLDGTFTRLKDLTFGYSLPAELSSRFGLRNARVYFNATNLFTIQSTTTIDPENFDGSADSSIIGSQHSPYPSAKTFSLGFNLQF
ncbi:MAG: TonB-dependent receptor [Balneolaceae bacterium]|nr:TonB-dependent receptor [Balneolaceae bacterium]